MHEIVRQPAPPKGLRVKRLTPKLKTLPVDMDNGVKLDFDTARCLRAYAEYHGWNIVQRRDPLDGSVTIWRIG